jgi:hypothetical protein
MPGFRHPSKAAGESPPFLFMKDAAAAVLATRPTYQVY